MINHPKQIHVNFILKTSLNEKRLYFVSAKQLNKYIEMEYNW